MIRVLARKSALSQPILQPSVRNIDESPLTHEARLRLANRANLQHERIATLAAELRLGALPDLYGAIAREAASAEAVPYATGTAQLLGASEGHAPMVDLPQDQQDRRIVTLAMCSAKLSKGAR